MADIDYAPLTKHDGEDAVEVDDVPVPAPRMSLLKRAMIVIGGLWQQNVPSHIVVLVLIDPA